MHGDGIGSDLRAVHWTWESLKLFPVDIILRGEQLRRPLHVILEKLLVEEEIVQRANVLLAFQRVDRSEGERATEEKSEKRARHIRWIRMERRGEKESLGDFAGTFISKRSR